MFAVPSGVSDPRCPITGASALCEDRSGTGRRTGAQRVAVTEVGSERGRGISNAGAGSGGKTRSGSERRPESCERASASVVVEVTASAIRLTAAAARRHGVSPALSR
jgi:hypothetical protein